MPFSILQALVLFSLYFFDESGFVQFSFYASISMVLGMVLSLRCEYWEQSQGETGAFLIVAFVLALIYEFVVSNVAGFHFFGVLLIGSAFQGLANKRFYQERQSLSVYVLCVVSIVPYVIWRSVDAAALSTGVGVAGYVLGNEVTRGSFRGTSRMAIKAIRRNFIGNRELQLNWFSSAIAILNQNWLPIQGIIFLDTKYLASFLFFWRAANFLPMFLSKPLSWKIYHQANQGVFKKKFLGLLMSGTLASIVLTYGLYVVFSEKMAFMSYMLVAVLLLAVMSRYAANLLTHALAFARHLSWAIGIQSIFLLGLFTNSIFVRDEVSNYFGFLLVHILASSIIAGIFFRLYDTRPSSAV